jgi:hypothetical protein
MAERLSRQFGIVGVPGGFHGSSKSYFEGLVANASTVARVTGQVRSFESLGVKRLVVVNPMDNRTSKICKHMNGKVFTIPQARNQLNADLGAATPEDVKVSHPWLSHKQLKTVSPVAGQVGKADAEALAAANVAMPPYHFRCRTTVDISASDAVIAAPPRLPTPKPPVKPKMPVPSKMPGQLPRLPNKLDFSTKNKHESSNFYFKNLDDADPKILANKLIANTEYAEFVAHRNNLTPQQWAKLVSTNRDKALGMIEDANKGLLRSWRATSSDSPLSIAIQEAARLEFGLENVAVGHFQPAMVKNMPKDAIPVLRAYLRAQYDATQQWFKDNGIKHVMLYRGQRWDKIPKQWSEFKFNKKAQIISTKLQPLNSFSINIEEARSFAQGKAVGEVMYAEVPVSKIASIPNVGFGVVREGEMITLGGVDKFKAVGWQGKALAPKDLLGALESGG